jgi:serine/threonine protein kinase
MSTDLEELSELHLLLEDLDSSSFSTPSAQSLLAHALAAPAIDASQLRHVRRIGEGAFAYIDLWELPPSKDVSAAGFSAAGATPAAGATQGTSLCDTSPRESAASPKTLGSIFKAFRRSSNPEMSHQSHSPRGDRLVLKHARKFETLELSNLAPGEREHVPIPESEQIKLFAEAVLLRAISHANIVKCHGAVQVIDPQTKERTFAIVEELVAGGTLQAKINAGGYSRDAGLGWLLDIARALRYLHEELPLPIAHRDLKPENILLAADGGSAKLCDFGLFRFMEEGGAAQQHAVKPRSNTLELPGGRKPLRHAITTGKTGSNRYMAPENYRMQAYTPAIDVFSFALIAWETLARKRAHGELYLTAEQIVEAVATRGLRPPLPADWSAPLKSLLEQMWSAEPAERPRFSTIVAKLEAIQAAGGMSELPPRRRSFIAGLRGGAAPARSTTDRRR